MEQIGRAFTLSMKEQKKYFRVIGVVARMCFVKKVFHKIYRKTPVPVSLYNKVAGPGLQLYQKRDFSAGVFL